MLMTKAQEEFYKFAIASENYEAIIDIAENFEEIKSPLIYHFWEDIKNECIRLLNDKPEWEVYLSPYSDEEQEDFLIYKKEYLRRNSEDYELTISFDNMYYQPWLGLWISKDPTLFNRDQVLKSAKDNKISGWRFGSNYPFYKNLPEDFSDYSGLRKIQPGNRSSLVHQYSHEIVNSIKDLEPFINKYILKKK